MSVGPEAGSGEGSSEVTTGESGVGAGRDGQLPRFLAAALGVAVVTILIGYLPTRNLGGDEAVTAMLAGCAVSLLASVAGGLPVLLAPPEMKPQDRLVRNLVSLAARLGTLVVLGAAAALTGMFALGPLLLWIALSHLALLGVDTFYALRLARGR